MGCTSSKNVDVYDSAKKPLPPPQSPIEGDAHLVALTSSSYGFLRVDSHKRYSAEEAAAMAEDDDPVKEVYHKMMSVDSSSSQLPPQSWSEVNSVLTQLKSQAQNKKPTVAAKGAFAGRVAETVDVSKLLRTVDDTPNHDAPPKAAAAAAVATTTLRRPAAQHKRDLSVIHTLEEVDLQLAHSNSTATSQDGCTSDTESEDDFLRHSTLPSSRSRDTHAASVGGNKNRFSMSSVVRRPDRQSKVPSKASKSLSVDSTLFDAEFLESFKEAFEQLSGGVPAAAPTGKHASSQPRPKATAQSKAMVPFQAAKVEEQAAPLKAPRGAVEVLGNKSSKLPLQQQQTVSREDGQIASKKQAVVTSREEEHNIATKKQEARGAVQNQVASWNKRSQDKGGQTIHQKKLEAPPPPPPDPLQHFPKKCPPDGGENKAVLYSTSLRGIRKTFEDCNTVRNILHSINVELDERDVSMDSQFRQELKDLMDDKPVPVPRLFIRGRYIGGVEEVLQAHESGTLVKLLQGLPQGNLSKDCDGCGGVRFIPCTDCSGSCKSVGPGGGVVKCPECNENGLVRCPICS